MRIEFYFKRKKHTQAALEYFGTTNDFAKAGFIIDDGRMLNLVKVSTMGGVQHRAIKAVFDDQSGDVVNRFILSIQPRSKCLRRVKVRGIRLLKIKHLIL